jgi:hypothetical protein
MAFQPQPVMAFPKSPTAMLGNNRIERFNYGASRTANLFSSRQYAARDRFTNWQDRLMESS